MEKIARKDILDIARYEKIRATFRQRIIDLKAHRRISVGPTVTLVFENRDTVLFQIQEMMRVERMVREDQIQFEIDTYNVLIPDKNELSATLFIEITDQDRMKEILDSFIGLDQGEKVSLQFGKDRAFARFEEGHGDEDKISAVHFVRFVFTPEQAARFRTEDRASLVVRHGAYKHETPLSEEARRSLMQDLGA